MALKKLTRAELVARAIECGISAPEKLGKKALIIAAIEEAEGEAPSPDLFKTGARVISVFGPFGSRAMIEVSAYLAVHLFREPLADSGRTNVIDAVEHDLAEIRELDEELANSALAATAERMAYELEHPFNSATSKAQCAKALNETMDRLRELSPEQEEGDSLDAISNRRKGRRTKP